MNKICKYIVCNKLGNSKCSRVRNCKENGSERLTMTESTQRFSSALASKLWVLLEQAYIITFHMSLFQPFPHLCCLLNLVQYDPSRKTPSQHVSMPPGWEGVNFQRSFLHEHHFLPFSPSQNSLGALHCQPEQLCICSSNGKETENPCWVGVAYDTCHTIYNVPLYVVP